MGKKRMWAALLVLLGLLLWPKERETESVIMEESPYTLREYEGCVAIYCSGETLPGTVTDIEVRLLPERDREQLQSGLGAADMQELSRLLEDLGS